MCAAFFFFLLLLGRTVRFVYLPQLFSCVWIRFKYQCNQLHKRLSIWSAHMDFNFHCVSTEWQKQFFIGFRASIDTTRIAHKKKSFAVVFFFFNWKLIYLFLCVRCKNSQHMVFMHTIKHIIFFQWSLPLVLFLPS